MNGVNKLLMGVAVGMLITVTANYYRPDLLPVKSSQYLTINKNNISNVPTKKDGTVDLTKFNKSWMIIKPSSKE